MDQDNNDPLARLSDDQITEKISILYDLGQHDGYRMVLDDLLQQYNALAVRLVAASDLVEIHRVQGAMRCLGDIIEHGNTGAALRERMIVTLRYELDERKEERLNA